AMQPAVARHRTMATRTRSKVITPVARMDCILSRMGAEERIGRYELVSALAKGGMAELYLARATGPEGFERLVVLKRILPQPASARECVAMFLDEARIAATLHHPNIVQVYDVLHAGDSYAIAMEYLYGADLATVFKAARTAGVRIPLEIVLHVIGEVCAGLH